LAIAPTAKTESELVMISEEEPLIKSQTIIQGIFESSHLEAERALLFCQANSVDRKLLVNAQQSNNKLSDHLPDTAADISNMPPYPKDIDLEEFVDTKVQRSYVRAGTRV